MCSIKHFIQLNILNPNFCFLLVYFGEFPSEFVIFARIFESPSTLCCIADMSQQFCLNAGIRCDFVPWAICNINPMICISFSLAFYLPFACTSVSVWPHFRRLLNISIVLCFIIENRSKIEYYIPNNFDIHPIHFGSHNISSFFSMVIHPWKEMVIKYLWPALYTVYFIRMWRHFVAVYWQQCSNPQSEKKKCSILICLIAAMNIIHWHYYIECFDC